jgi:hypothetical protein
MSSKKRKSTSKKRKSPSKKRKSRKSRAWTDLRKRKQMASSSPQPTWDNRTWVMDAEGTGGSQPPDNTFSADAQFSLQSLGASQYKVIPGIGMPSTWVGCVLTEYTGSWPKAWTVQTPKYSSNKTKFDDDAQTFLNSFDSTIRRLSGPLTANGDDCTVTMFQVDDQIQGGGTMLIVWIVDETGNTNPGGGIWGHS